MASTHITRCPHCQTSFRVSMEQLTVAKGSVRCGSCLQVFKAAEYFINDKTPSKTPPSADALKKQAAQQNAQTAALEKQLAQQKAQAAALEKQAAERQAVEKQAELKRAALKQAAEKQAKLKQAAKQKALLEQQAALKAEKQKAQAEKVAKQKAEQVAQQKAQAKKVAQQKADQIAQQLASSQFDDIPDQINDDPLFDLNILTADRKKPSQEDNAFALSDDVYSQMLSKADKSQAPMANEFDFLDFDELSEPANENSQAKTQDQEEAWAQALLEDDSSVEEPQQEERSASYDEDSFVKARQEEYQDDFYISDDDQPSDTQNAESDDFYHSEDLLASESGLTAEEELELGELEAQENELLNINALADTDLSTDIYDIREEPLALEQESPTSPANIIGAIAALLLIVMLLAQTAYFNFAQWSRHPDFRQYYQVACQAINCQLPSIQDVKQMATQHLVVRSHAKYDQALVVDSIIINRSDFQQPFPNLELIFTGLNEQVIASRKFRPDQYLAGELTGNKHMPSKTPIHISLNIQDPGPEAVNYRLQLVANQ